MDQLRRTTERLGELETSAAALEDAAVTQGAEIAELDERAAQLFVGLGLERPAVTGPPEPRLSSGPC